MNKRERRVLDGPGFGKGIGELLTLEQRKRVKKLGSSAGKRVVDFLNRHGELAERIRGGDIVDSIEISEVCVLIVT